LDVPQARLVLPLSVEPLLIQSWKYLLPRLTGGVLNIRIISNRKKKQRVLEEEKRLRKELGWGSAPAGTETSAGLINFARMILKL
jgi:hypothetical protein